MCEQAFSNLIDSMVMFEAKKQRFIDKSSEIAENTKLCYFIGLKRWRIECKKDPPSFGLLGFFFPSAQSYLVYTDKLFIYTTNPINFDIVATPSLNFNIKFYQKYGVRLGHLNEMPTKLTRYFLLLHIRLIGNRKREQ